MKLLKITVLILLVLFAEAAFCPAQTPDSANLFVIWDERGKFGYMDRSGHVRIKPQFDEAHPFFEGLAAVSLNEKWGFIDATGKVVIPITYYYVRHYSEGLAAVMVEDTSCAYVDPTGRLIIKMKKEYQCFDFYEGYASVGIYDQAVTDIFTARGRIIASDRRRTFAERAFRFVPVAEQVHFGKFFSVQIS